MKRKLVQYSSSESESDDEDFSDSESISSFDMPFKKFRSDEIKFQLPCTGMICGAQSSGKTTFVVECMKHVDELFHPQPKKIVYCYSEYNTAIRKLQQLGVTVHQGLPNDEFLDRCKKPMILILDDMMLHADKKYLDLLYTVKSHHKNIGVFFLTQNIFHKDLKTARDNCQYLILMSSPSLIRQIHDIGSNLFPGKTKQFMEVYDKCTNTKYGYVVINLHAATPKELRLYTKIFPYEHMRVFVL